MADITGTVTLDGTALEGAKITAIDQEVGDVIGTATSAADGSYTIANSRNTTALCLMEYDDGAGTAYQAHSQPFVTVESALAAPVSAEYWWPMDEGSGTTIADNVSTADGTLTGAGWVTGTWMGDSAVSFDGVDDYATATVGSQAHSLLTVACTVEASSWPAELDQILDAEVHPSTGALGRFFRNNNGSNIQFAVHDGGGFVSTATSGLPAVDTKHRFVGVFDGTNVILYHNASQVGSTASTNSAINDWFFNGMGARPNDQIRFFNGRIDDVILDSTAYTAQQVQDDYARQPWTA